MDKDKDIWEDFYDSYGSNGTAKTYRCDDCNYKWKNTTDAELYEDVDKEEEDDGIVYDEDAPECCPVCGSENIVEM